MVLVHPEHPAVPNYPSQDHVKELDSALARIELELSTNEGWEDQGEREGVQLYKKPDPSVSKLLLIVRYWKNSKSYVGEC